MRCTSAIPCKQPLTNAQGTSGLLGAAVLWAPRSNHQSLLRADVRLRLTSQIDLAAAGWVYMVCSCPGRSVLQCVQYVAHACMPTTGVRHTRNCV